MYLFTSERLGFRAWRDDDYDNLYRLCSDPDVMHYFPGTLDPEATAAFLERLQRAYEAHGYCYFAVEERGTETFIGFIGIAYQTYKMDFTPATDIGWRLLKEHWKKGYATEGARRCLRYAREEHQLNRLIATTTHNNDPSVAVMRRIGMNFVKAFVHPNIDPENWMQPCVLYEIDLTQTPTRL